jgi:hypothetical protein
MKELEDLTISCDINDVLYHMNEAEYGAHYIIIYPNLATIRQLYASYIPKQIQENNEIVLVNPFYETTESTRQVLSQRNPDLDVSKYEKEKSLIIIDSLEEYFGKPSDGMPFKRSLASNLTGEYFYRRLRILCAKSAIYLSVACFCLAAHSSILCMCSRQSLID